MFSERRDLLSGEKVVYIARLSLWPHFFELLLGVLLTPLVLGLFILARIAINYKSTTYIVTSRRFIASNGFFTRKTESIAHTKAFGLEITQTLLGRIFNYGTITLRAPQGGDGAFMGINISSPNTFDSYYSEATTRFQKKS
ncbi:PH domain-containing protein [Teredinibacter turnerae]|uniref:PH domain-containing protein n=1 Tax=Teredinibacter turnerae TaxID=2426 RepID=UPI000367A25C